MSLVEKIKEHVTIKEALEKYTLADLSKVRGSKSISIRCPFHDDNRPSFSFKPEANIWRCWSGCGGGDVISLVEVACEVTNGAAIKILAKDYGLSTGKLSNLQQKRMKKRIQQKQADKKLLHDYKKRNETAFQTLLQVEKYINRVIEQAARIEGALDDYADLIHLFPYIGYLLDCLIYTDTNEEAELSMRMEATLQAEKVMGRLAGEPSRAITKIGVEAGVR